MSRKIIDLVIHWKVWMKLMRKKLRKVKFFSATIINPNRFKKINHCLKRKQICSMEQQFKKETQALSILM